MHYLTTTDMPLAEQFGYWREVILDACTPLHIERAGDASPDRGFASSLRYARLMSTNCAEVRSLSQSMIHGPAEVRRQRSEDVFISLTGRALRE